MKTNIFVMLLLVAALAIATASAEVMDENEEGSVAPEGAAVIDENATDGAMSAAEEMEESDCMAAADEFMMSLPDSGFYLMEVEDLIAMVEAEDEGFMILDVRPADSYAAGYIPGSVNIPDPELIARMDEVPADKMIAVVCQLDTNSAFAVAMLRVFGDRDAWIVNGGVTAWEDAGKELEVPEVA
ncbi:MAG: rhodanese-like domain-containing protein [Methanosarcinales archaeon]|nr:rhodanese-like domain-containing protein [Methanosarcinales archaeon]